MPKLIGKRFQSQYPLKISLDWVQFIFEQLPDSAAAVPRAVPMQRSKSFLSPMGT